MTGKEERSSTSDRALAGAGSISLLLVTIDEQARPLSLRILGAYAESLGVRTSILVMLRKLAIAGSPVLFSDPDISRILDLLKKEGVTHIGFYLMTASLKPYRLIVKALRAGGFTGVIMAGGVHPTLCPGESLVEGADFAVQGPGELPLEMILKGTAPAEIPGLVWRNASGETVVNDQSDDQKLNLDDLPFPIFRTDGDWIMMNGRIRRLTWAMHQRHAGWHGRYYDLITSRGCAYRCAYCCNVSGAPVRRASVDRVIRELKHVKETVPGIKGVNIQDDSFYAGSEEWVREFCARMKTEIGLPFIIRMIPRYVTQERIDLLKDAGLKYVTMGLEGSTRINRDLFNRKEDSRSFLNAARLVLDAGLLLSIDLIIDNPYENENDLREVAMTLNQLDRPHWWIVALSLTPFPHTPIFKRCAVDGMLEKFATDAYDAMLNPSISGGYRTPRFWYLLITKLLPYVQPKLGARLIAMGPDNPKAVHIVESLARSVARVKSVATWLRDKTPWFYGAAGGVFKRFAPASGGE